MHRQSEKNFLNSNNFSALFSQYGELQPTNGSLVWAPQQVSTGFVYRRHYCTDVACRCLAVYWAGTLHFRGLLPPDGMLPGAPFTLRPSLAFSYILAAYTARYSSMGVSQTLQCGTRNGITERSQRAPPVFGRAAITLGIGPHSSLKCILA